MNPRHAESAAPPHAVPTQAVLWATPRAAPDLPVDADLPAALLPLGGASLIENLIEALARQGVKRIDLVVCDRPEALRERLGEGERWGVDLRWHLARDPQQPYGVLRHLDLSGSPRLILGHLDRWIDPAALTRLADHGGCALMLDAADAPVWSGWACLGAVEGLANAAACDEAGLRRALMAMALRSWLVEPGEIVAMDAAGLVAVQHRLARRGQPPAHWRVTPWGAMSPHAHVHPSAQVVGPVWIGPGCVVADGARIGPDVLLAEDVVVAGGADVSHSVVLPSSYIGAGLSLRQALVSGTRVRHLELGIETTMPSSEGLLLSLHATPQRRPWLLARLLAALAVSPLLGLLPLALAVSVHRRRRGGPPARPWLLWQGQDMVVGHAEQGAQPLLGRLRSAHPHHRGVCRWVAQAGGLLDIVQGRRCWFGVRARRSSEWYALSAEWQLLLRDAPIGVFHAPAWDEDEVSRSEAQAAADVHHAAQPAPARHIAVVRAWFRRWLGAAPRRTQAT